MLMLPLALPGLISVVGLAQATVQVGSLADAAVPGAQIVGRIDALMNKYRKEQWEYLALPPGDKELAETRTSMQEEDAEMKGLFADFRKLPTDSANLAALTAFEQHWTEYVQTTAGDGQPLRMPGIVPKLSATPGAMPAPAPKLGEHTEQVLKTIGYSIEEISRLKEAKIV